MIFPRFRPFSRAFAPLAVVAVAACEPIPEQSTARAPAPVRQAKPAEGETLLNLARARAARLGLPCLSLDLTGCTERCNAGDAVSCDRLVSLGVLTNGPALRGLAAPEAMKGPDALRQVSILEKTCDAHYGPACIGLASRLTTGRGVSTDLLRAATVRELALTLLPAECEAGDSTSCALLSDVYERGEELPQNSAKAEALMQRSSRLVGAACEAGDVSSCSFYGMEISSRDARNAKTGVKYLQKGCDGGDGYGCDWLGRHYAKGLGVSQDAQKAHLLFRRACVDGLLRACIR